MAHVHGVYVSSTLLITIHKQADTFAGQHDSTQLVRSAVLVVVAFWLLDINGDIY